MWQRKQFGFTTLALCLGLISAHCNSLISETQRIQAAYDRLYGQSPQVTSTDPADNTIAPYNQQTITVTFDSALDASTITAQPQFGPCSGSFQLSYDNFTNCLGGTIDTSGNPTVVFKPVIFPKTLQLQVRITTAALSPYGKSVQAYTMPLGFRLGAPCGTGNCFFSYSTPLMTNAGGYSGIFLVRGGALAGKYIVYTMGQATTTVIDPVAATSATGPSLTGSGSPCALPNNSTHNFLNNAGTKEIIIIGGTTTQTCAFDHATNTFSAGPSSSSGMGLGSYSFKPLSGTELGNTLITTANNSFGVAQYKANDTWNGVLVYSLTPGAANLGAHALRPTTGLNYANKWIHFNTGTQVSIFNESSPGMIAGFSLGASGVAQGAASFEVFSGARTGQIFTIMGGATSNVFAFDLVADAAAASQPVGMVNTVTFGSMLLRQAGTPTQDAPVFLFGSTFATSQFDASAGMFPGQIYGQTATGVIAGGSASIFMGNPATGAFFIVNGNSGPSTSVFDPQTMQFNGSRLPTNLPNTAAHAFYVGSGTYAGKTIVVSGSGYNETGVFDPIKFQFSRGPQLTATGTANTFSIPLTAGTHAGKIIAVALTAGGISAFNPATGTYSNATALSPPIAGFPALGTGTLGFYAEQIINDPRIVFVQGGGSTSASMYDQSTNSFGSVLTIGCAVNLAPLAIRYSTSANVTKHLVPCNTTTMAILDHSTMSFATTVTMSPTINVNVQAFVIPSGSNAGNVLVMHGSPATTSAIIDANTNAVNNAGPSLAACASAPGGGSRVIYIRNGLNAGKVLVILGGGSANTCMFDPSTNSFSAGPTIVNTTSPGFQINTGSVAFPANGGLYATSTILLTGTNRNVWSSYAP